MLRPGEQGILPEDAGGFAGGDLDQVGVPVEVGDPERGKSALLRSKNIPRAAQAEILLGNHKAIVASLQDPQAFHGFGTSASLDQDTG